MPICSSLAIKLIKKNVNSVLTDAVENEESIQLRKGKAKPTNLPAICAQKEVQTNNDLLNNRQTLCKEQPGR